jgi:hypothetical protein
MVGLSQISPQSGRGIISTPPWPRPKRCWWLEFNRGVAADQVLPDPNKGRVQLKFFKDMVMSVIGVENYHHTIRLLQVRTDLGMSCFIDGGAFNQPNGISNF